MPIKWFGLVSTWWPRAAVLLAVLALGPPNQARAVPVLQMYLEGATYNAADDTWVLDTTEHDNPNWQQYVVPGTTTSHFRLWVIGDTSQSSDGIIHNVQLAASYIWQPSFGYVNITMRGSQTNGVGGFTDPSVAPNPTFVKKVDDGSVPVLGDGKTLLTTLDPSAADHYGQGYEWQQFSLGDFTSHDSPIGDFSQSPPTIPKSPDMGQINVYDIYVDNSDLEGNSIAIHFDVYDHVVAQHKSKTVVSADGATAIVPAPAGATLFGVGLAGLAGYRWLRRRPGDRAGGAAGGEAAPDLQDV